MKGRTMQEPDSYYQFFGLGKDPFPVNTFDNVLFLTPELTRRIEQIRHMLTETDKLVLVTACNGAGKSTLADYIESIAEKHWSVCLIQAVSGMDRETLAHEIIQQMSPDKADEKSFAIPQLHKFLESCSRLERLPVIIIDDADMLPVQTLGFILELSALKHLETCFRFLLFAGENINDRLGQESLAELQAQLVSRVNLPAFSRHQVKEYIDTRLGSAGEVSTYPFSDKDIDTIYRISAGLPLGINILARDIMQTTSSVAGNSASPRLKLLAVAAVIIIAVSVILVYQPEPVTPIQTAHAPAITPPPTEPAAPDSPDNTTNVMENREEPVPLPGNNISDMPEPGPGEPADNPASEGVLSQSRIGPADELTGVENQVTDIATGTTTNATQDMPANAATATGPRQADPGSIDRENTDSGPGNVQAVAGDHSLPTAVATAMPADSDDSSRAAAEEATPPAASVPANRNDMNIYQLDTIPAAITGIRGEQWFRDQDGAAYTLQLISASQIGNVLQLIDGIGLQQELSGYVKYTPSGRPRYLLFFGVYPDRDSAEAAIAGMPDRLAAVNPYPRSISSIINEIETVGYWPR